MTIIYEEMISEKLGICDFSDQYYDDNITRYT